MERFTVKNKSFNDYSVAEGLRNLDVRDYLYQVNQKVGRYEDLEEQIGCPLGVRVSLYCGALLIGENCMYCVNSIGESSFWAHKIGENGTDLGEIELFYKDYMKVWR